MRRTVQRILQEECGRTLSEFVIAMAIMGVVGGIISGTQLNALKWYQQDQQVAKVIRPLRDATDFLTRDVEFAASVEIASGQLVVKHDRKNASTGAMEKHTITYHLDHGTLIREEAPPSGAATVRSLVSGLTAFEPSLVASGLVQIRFATETGGLNAVSRDLTIQVVPRKGVGG